MESAFHLALRWGNQSRETASGARCSMFPPLRPEQAGIALLLDGLSSSHDCSKASLSITVELYPAGLGTAWSSGRAPASLTTRLLSPGSVLHCGQKPRG